MPNEVVLAVRLASDCTSSSDVLKGVPNKEISSYSKEMEKEFT